MTGETSGPSAQDIRMASFEEKFNDLLNFLIPTSHPRTIPSPKGNWNTLEGPQSLQMYGNGEENVMNKKEDDHSDIRSLQGQPLYPSNQGDTIEPHSDVDGHSSKGSKESEKEAQSPISKKEEPKEVDHPMIPHKRPHLLHDSSKKCEFHFGRPGHSLEDCHALKNKVQDLVDHGILRINEGSTPSVIIAWPPEHCKDETVIPSPQSQGPTTCGIQPVHLTTLPTLSEVGEHTVPKTQPKLMSNFRNLDDQCSSDKEKAEYCTNRCVTLKRKIQGLGHSEPDVPFMVQARKPSMHTVPMKKARSTLGFRRQWAIKRSDRANHFQGAPEPGSRIAKDEFSRPRHHHHRRGRSTH
uniref:Retrotransposon gag domain-containing protein n=1 Tax=Fagus sylvatica TaxID=28930 RepID=A0A2N9FCU4_FAGSY